MLIDSFGNRLNEAMRTRNVEQVDLIKKTKEVMKKYIKDYDGEGIDKTLVSKYVNGKINAKQDNLFFLAVALNVSEAWLMGLDVPMQRINIDNATITDIPNDIIKIPILGKIPAGTPVEAIEDILGYESVPNGWIKKGEKYFALKVEGNSMLPDYKENDIIIVRQVNDCKSGDDCVVMVNGHDATFKKVIKEADGIKLKPLNNDYETMKFTNDEIKKMPVVILGIVEKMVRNQLKTK